MRILGHVFLVSLLAAVTATGIATVWAADAGAPDTNQPPAKAETHKPMNMDEDMPTKMKKPGMTKGEVMKGAEQNRQRMEGVLKQEESAMPAPGSGQAPKP